MNKLRKNIGKNSIYISLKKNQIPRSKLSKGCERKNYKPLKKEIEEDYRMWKDLPCS
jgi:hypothetical protein